MCGRYEGSDRVPISQREDGASGAGRTGEELEPSSPTGEAFEPFAPTREPLEPLAASGGERNTTESLRYMQEDIRLHGKGNSNSHGAKPVC